MATPDSRYLRAIIVSSPTAGRIDAAMEDDFHHFRVALDHHDGVVTHITAEAVRHPWSLCPAAAGLLQALVGTALTPSFAEALGRLPIREHCTHMYDLACLAIVHAAAGMATRRWDMAVDAIGHGTRQATLSIDGIPMLDWRIVGTDIAAPHGVTLKGDFVGWATNTLSDAEAEAAVLLRRAVFVSGGRRGDLDLRATAADGARNLGGCFVMRRGVAETALRMKGTSRRFTSDMPPLG